MHAGEKASPNPTVVTLHFHHTHYAILLAGAYVTFGEKKHAISQAIY